jgi:hypothetical protein
MDEHEDEKKQPGEHEAKFEAALDNVCKILSQIDDDEERTMLAFYAVLEIAYQSAGSHFEMLGLLREAEFTLREQSLEDMEMDDDRRSYWIDKFTGDN